jgi:oligopeptide transport system ATP-binding protein
MAELLKLENLETQFKTESGIVKACDGVSYYINEQEIIGLVGENGCGKSVSQLSVMQLINAPGKITGGEVIFEGQNLLKYPQHGAEMRSIRGAKIAMIFQEPMTSLNPVLTIGQQLTEMLVLHLKMSGDDARKRAIELLGMVGIPAADFSNNPVTSAKRLGLNTLVFCDAKSCHYTANQDIQTVLKSLDDCVKIALAGKMEVR